MTQPQPVTSLPSSDPLSKLHDLHSPEAIGFWPPAPGWWVLALLMAVTVFAVAWFIVQRQRRQRYRRAALTELNRIRQKQLTSADLNTLLKRTALVAFGRDQVAALQGPHWVAFLQASCPSLSAEQSALLVSLAQDPYRPFPPAVTTGLVDSCYHWIKRHTPSQEVIHADV